MGEIAVQGVQSGVMESTPGAGTGRERRSHSRAHTKAAALARWGTLAQRFWDRVRKGDGCWEWTGARGPDGYGKIEAFGKKHAGAHRVAWELVNGSIPPGLHVCHHCDNPRCVRTEPGGGGHLFLGTPRDNTHDSLTKGRYGSLKQAGKKRGPYRKRAA